MTVVAVVAGMALGQSQARIVRPVGTRLRWETFAVGPKVSDHWAEQRRAAERAVETLQRSSPSVRDRALLDAAGRPKRDTIPNEQGYLIAHYLVSFKADIVRLYLPEQLKNKCVMSTGTRDPEFLRMMYLAKVTDFGQSIGLGLLKVFPNDIQVKEVFVRDHVVLKARLENVRLAQKVLREDLAGVWTKEKVAYHEAVLQGTVLIHTRKMSDLELAVQLWKRFGEIDPSRKDLVKTELMFLEQKRTNYVRYP